MPNGNHGEGIEKNISYTMILDVPPLLESEHAEPGELDLDDWKWGMKKVYDGFALGERKPLVGDLTGKECYVSIKANVGRERALIDITNAVCDFLQSQSEISFNVQEISTRRFRGVLDPGQMFVGWGAWNE